VTLRSWDYRGAYGLRVMQDLARRSWQPGARWRMGGPADAPFALHLARDSGTQVGGSKLPLPPGIRSAAPGAGLRELVLGIRPEHLHLADGSGE
jgi:hypothetical protein